MSTLQNMAHAVHQYIFHEGPFSEISWKTSYNYLRNRPYVTLLSDVAQVPGDVIECGVYRGRSLMAMALRQRQLDAAYGALLDYPVKYVIGLDSFDGFREESILDCDVASTRSRSQLVNRFRMPSRFDTPTSLYNTATNMGLRVILSAGYFEDTLPKITQDRVFSFVHLDCDLYQSYKTCLEHLYPKVSPGGIILFDEYHNKDWAGAQQAIVEFLQDKPEDIRTVFYGFPYISQSPGYRNYIVKQ